VVVVRTSDWCLASYRKCNNELYCVTVTVGVSEGAAAVFFTAAFLTGALSFAAFAG
jgi:hypothetical protein